MNFDHFLNNKHARTNLIKNPTNATQKLKQPVTNENFMKNQIVLKLNTKPNIYQTLSSLT